MKLPGRSVEKDVVRSDFWTGKCQYLSTCLALQVRRVPLSFLVSCCIDIVTSEEELLGNKPILKITSPQIFVTCRPDHPLTELVILVPLQQGGGVAAQAEAVQLHPVPELVPEVGLAHLLSPSPQHWLDRTI